MRKTPDLHTKVSEITDPSELRARITYRVCLEYLQSGNAPEFPEGGPIRRGYVKAEVKRLLELEDGV